MLPRNEADGNRKDSDRVAIDYIANGNARHYFELKQIKQKGKSRLACQASSSRQSRMFPIGNKKAASNRPSRNSRNTDQHQADRNKQQPQDQQEKPKSKRTDTEKHKKQTKDGQPSTHTIAQTTEKNTATANGTQKSQQEHLQKKDRKRDSISDASRARQVPDGTLDPSDV